MKTAFLYLIILFVLATIISYFLAKKWSAYKIKTSNFDNLRTKTHQQIFKQVFVDESLQEWHNSFFYKILLKINISLFFELFLLSLWGIYIGWDYLDLDPRRIPMGREFGSVIQANHLWTQILNCGECAMWNGFQRGGYPFFTDIQGSMLHPVVIFSTLIWGVVNGVKITIVISLLLAGIAQWWIARELNLSWLPRMWSAGIAMAGGHLLGRMELGVYSVVLSTSMVSLVLASLIRLAKENNRRNALLLGILLACTIVSGQGYMQIGLIGILPIYVLFYWRKEHIFLKWKNYFLILGIAFLIAAPFLVPFLHFSPNISKWTDPEFTSAQPISYFLLNLVIDSPSYYHSHVMQKLPYPYLYSLYIGWIPIILFIFALNHITVNEKKIIGFMLSGILIEFLIASAFLLKLFVGVFPTLAGIRHPSLIAGAAIPLLLGISAYGLEKAISYLPARASLLVKWQNSILYALVIFLLAYSLNSCVNFSSLWTKTFYLKNDLFISLEKLKTPDMQWVNPPFGEHSYVEPAIAMGLKLSPGILPWYWSDRTSPNPYITANRYTLVSIGSKSIAKPSEINFNIHVENIYAYVKTQNNKIVICKAIGSGGSIKVYCNTNENGVLIVQENMWTGWYAWVDSTKTELVGSDRLEVYAPAGVHTYTFKYLPWDVPLGLILFVIGIILYIFLWFTPERLKN